MFEKNLWKSDILSKDAGHRHFFASKNQLPGFYISGTLVENGLIQFTMNQNYQKNCLKQTVRLKIGY